MNKLIYFENEFNKNKESISDLYKLRSDLYALQFNQLERIEFNALCDLLKRINKAIEWNKNIKNNV
jgi:hypothetical protein